MLTKLLRREANNCDSAEVLFFFQTTDAKGSKVHSEAMRRPYSGNISIFFIHYITHLAGLSASKWLYKELRHSTRNFLK